MLKTFTVAFIGHRYIENSFAVEKKLDRLIADLLGQHEYVEFLVGRDGEFDQLATSVQYTELREPMATIIVR